MKLLGIDFETTGVDAEKDRITEIGAVYWDTETNSPIDLVNQLVNAKDRPPLSQQIIEITGITEEMLEENGVDEDTAFQLIYPWVEKADFIVAHNGEFDRGFFQAYLRRIGAPALETPWICTMRDIPYPKTMTARNLTTLAAQHFYINYFPHRAVFDVLATMYVLSQYDINEVIKLSQEKEFKVQALVSFHDKELAKERGYRWDGENKQWIKILKESFVKKELEEVSFQTRVTEIRAE